MTRLRPSAYPFAFVLLALALFTGCSAKPADEPTIRERSRVSIVRDRPGDVRCDGIGPLRGFAKGRDCTFMHCLELVLEASGRKINYDELMGLSGMAFRTQFRTDRWDVGNPDPLAGEPVLDILFPAIGWDYELRIVKQEDYAEKDALYRAVAKSIDAGLPVLAANIIPPEDWGLIVGYRGPRTWLCRSYNGDAETSDKPATGWPTATLFLTNKKSRPDPRKMHFESIRRAIEMFDRKAGGANLIGKKALEAWVEALRSPKDRTYIHANFWTYVSLIDARGAAVRYLRMIAKDYGSRDLHIGMAADYYDSEVRLLLDGMNNVPAEHTFPVGLPPAEYRNKQIDTLRQAIALEEKAVESLKKAQ